MARKLNPTNDPRFLDCPYCHREDGAAPTGKKDTQGKHVFRCAKCDRTFGEHALDAASRERARKRLRED
jgi:transposase-like protein